MLAIARVYKCQRHAPSDSAIVLTVAMVISSSASSLASQIARLIQPVHIIIYYMR